LNRYFIGISICLVHTLFFRANANPLVCDSNGNTPLHLACRMGFTQGAVAILNRTHHLNPSDCHIPELSIHNSNGEYWAEVEVY